MLIEMHMIQNHNPSNLNRDDQGAPKTAVFGGALRARISSQCLKRSIRRSEDFQKAMEQDGGVRTRRLITLLAEGADTARPVPEGLLKLVTDAFEKGGIKRDPTKDDPHATNILLFLPESTIQHMITAVSQAWREKKSAAELCEELARILGEKAAVPDIALCGRMTELDSEGLFRKVNFDVDGALAAAHALSTHEIVNEVDYFTAVDDRAAGHGAGHVNEAMYVSACFYKHFSLDWDQLTKNLGDDQALAALTLRQFILAAATSVPSGKQKSFAAFNLPEGILIEVKTNGAKRISYANAFADPVPLKCERGLIGESVARLGQYIHDMTVGFSLPADRFWFSPGGRCALTYVAPAEGGRQPEETQVLKDNEKDPRNLNSLDALVERVVKSVEAHVKTHPVGAA
ncbi:MAG: type I-E CRISPR-associated protein Cas7/Cse4/CasC [Acidobacteriota bacterium]